MQRGSLKWFYLTILMCILYTSCSVTRYIPEDQLLLSRVEVVQIQEKSTPKEDLISTSTLERYTRQSPNKRLFGFNFYLWMHYLANPEKSNWWNNLKSNIGEEPVYLDLSLVEKSQENLNAYMDSQGFYSSTAEYVVDTVESRRRARVRYETNQGRPYIISSLEYNFADTLLRPIVAADTTRSLIKRGDIFSVTLLDQERERISDDLRNRGYFDFTVRNIEYQADTLAGDYTVALKMIINRNLSGYDSRGNALYESNKRYRIAEINILSDFNPSIIVSDSSFLSQVDTLRYRGLNIIHYDGKLPRVRAQVLRQMIPLSVGSMYDSRSVSQTYQNLMSLGYFKSARINFLPRSFEQILGDSIQLDEIERYYTREERRVGVDSLLSGQDNFLVSNILATPALKQSYEIELEGSTTSSFYGLYATAGYQNRNIFRGAEAWNVDFTVGYEYMKAPDAVKKRATEIGVATGLTFPRFVLPFVDDNISSLVQPKTSVDLSVNFQDRPYYNRTLSSASFGYSWRNRGYSTFSVRPFEVNVIDMNYIDEIYYDALENDYLRNSYETQLTMGFNLGYAYSNQRKNLGGNYTLFRFNVEGSGNFLNLMESMFNAPKSDDGYYEIFSIRYAQYVRSDMNISQKITIGERSAVVGRLYAGAGLAYGNSTAIPFDRLFYSGGSNSMRGWSPRTLGPGSSTEEIDSVYPSQLGDMKLEANLEFRFPIWDILHGATFLDLGNIWYMKNSDGIYDEETVFRGDTFYKQLGFNTGFGLRLDIQFAVLRLDWGVQLYNPNYTEGSRWVIGDWDWNNSALNFGVGYPF